LPVAKTWSDLDLEFTAHPNMGTLGIKRNEQAIVRSIRHLILTNRFERPFRPDLGCHIRARLFDPISFATSLRIKEDIITTIANYEPRVRISGITVEAKDKENGYLVGLSFYIINEEVERKVTFFLERNR